MFNCQMNNVSAFECVNIMFQVFIKKNFHDQVLEFCFKAGIHNFALGTQY